MSGSWDATVKVWDLETGLSTDSLVGDAGDAVHSLAWAAHTDLVAVGGRKSVVSLWDIAAGRAVASLDGHSKQVYAVHFTEPRRVLSASGDTLVKVWDARTAECVHSLAGHTSAAMCVQSDDVYKVRLRTGAGVSSSLTCHLVCVCYWRVCVCACVCTRVCMRLVCSAIRWCRAATTSQYCCGTSAERCCLLLRSLVRAAVHCAAATATATATSGVTRGVSVFLSRDVVQGPPTRREAGPQLRDPLRRCVLPRHRPRAHRVGVRGPQHQDPQVQLCGVA